MALARRNVPNLNGNFGILPDMGQNATAPQGRNSGTVHCDRNSDAPSYKTALKLQICQNKSTFRGFLLKIFPKFERPGQKAPRVSIITAAGITQGDYLPHLRPRAVRRRTEFHAAPYGAVWQDFRPRSQDFTQFNGALNEIREIHLVCKEFYIERIKGTSFDAL